MNFSEYYYTKTLLEIKIEILDKNNKENVLKIAEWCFNEWKNEYNNMNSINDYINYLNDEKMCYYTFIAIDTKNKNICGTISIVKKDINSMYTLEPFITSLFIDKPYRRIGMSELLVNYCIYYIQQNTKYSNIYLQTTDKYLSFYLKRLFEIIYKIKNTDTDTENDKNKIIMAYNYETKVYNMLHNYLNKSI